MSKTTTKPAGQFGIDRDHDVPWNATKVAVFKALKALGCTSASTGRSAEDVAKKAGLDGRQVRHYVYHAKAAGLADVADSDAGRVYYLTAKGAKLSPARELEAQNNGKE
jgi:hypothetical protein